VHLDSTGSGRLSDWVAVMSVEATTDGDVFLAYQLKPGQQVVMDYLGAHKVDGVGKLIEDTGASLCYLPPHPRTSTHRKMPGADEAEPSLPLPRKTLSTTSATPGNGLALDSE
jgi:hypothetical protein